MTYTLPIPLLTGSPLKPRKYSWGDSGINPDQEPEHISLRYRAPWNSVIEVRVRVRVRVRDIELLGIP